MGAIVLIGFMGAGKSAALAAARKQGLETTEIDEMMERELGKPIKRAFEEDGEEAFRAREAEIVGSLLQGADGGVIALGGGSVLSERVREALDRHIVVLLEVDAATAWERIKGTDRPLARSEADVERLLAERSPLYEELADVVVPMVDKEAVGRTLSWVEAVRRLPDGTRMLWATSKSGAYPIVIGRGILGSQWWPMEGRQFVVCDPNTREYLDGALRPAAEPVELPEAGETAKTLGAVREVLEELTEKGMTRKDYLVAFGGGVVGDTAGLCAHLYQRGVPVVQVPTTLMAQVDSAYGGKTGVDLPKVKNYVGAYHQPAAVIVDIEALDTLPQEELAAGFVEVLKTGLLEGGELWERARKLEKIVPAELGEIIFECARFKCEVVAEDERDEERRHILNFGHTVGHAIEAATQYKRYKHGEAVGLGLLAALELSGRDDLRDEVEAILRRHGLPVRLDPDVEVEQVLTALERDKKSTPDGVRFVLLPKPGDPRPGEAVDPAKVKAAVENLY